jgi:hypothetical protein
MFFIFPRAHFINIKLKMFQHFSNVTAFFPSTFLVIFRSFFVNILQIVAIFLGPTFFNQHFSRGFFQHL